ncbi:hypothetical protein Tco_1349007, partial [Tanacetum coccineum]
LCEQEAGGSSDGPKRRRTYIFREREEAEQRLIDDYFGDDEYEPKYPEEKFRRRYFRVRIDAIGRNSIGPILKCTSAIRQMAYGTAPDAFDEYLQIAERTSRECLDHFTKCIHVERCDVHVRKTKELRDRKMHNDLRQDLVEHLWNNDDE